MAGLKRGLFQCPKSPPKKKRVGDFFTLKMWNSKRQTNGELLKSCSVLFCLGGKKKTRSSLMSVSNFSFQVGWGPILSKASCRIFDASPSRDPSCNGALHLPGGMSTNPAIRCHCQGHTAGGVGHMTSGPNDGPRGTNDAPK